MKLTKEQIEFANTNVNTLGLDKVSEKIVDNLPCIKALDSAEQWLYEAKHSIEENVSAMPDDASAEQTAKFAEYAENMGKVTHTKARYISTYRAAVRARLERYVRAQIVRQSKTLRQVSKVTNLLNQCMADGIDLKTILSSIGHTGDTEKIQENIETMQRDQETEDTPSLLSQAENLTQEVA